MTTLSGANKSETYIHIETPPGVKDVDTKIDTGITNYGATGSIGIMGDFDLMEGPAIFNGP